MISRFDQNGWGLERKAHLYHVDIITKNLRES